MSHYETLEIHERASPEVVRAAYRSLIQRFHPDRRPDDPAAAARAAALTEAYEVLSDPERRSAYDRWLADQRAAARSHTSVPTQTTASRAGNARTAARPHPAAARARGGRRGAGMLWGWALLMLLLLGAAFWLMRPRHEVPDEWSSLRQRFSASGQTEQDLRALIRRRDELLQGSPELRERLAAEIRRDRESRTVELLETPLELVFPAGVMRIPHLQLVLGSFDAGVLRAYILKNRVTLVDELVKALKATELEGLAGPDGEAQLQALVLDVMVRALSTHPLDDYPSTWFESPGRYGVVAVQLPQRYRLQLVAPEPAFPGLAPSAPSSPYGP